MNAWLNVCLTQLDYCPGGEVFSYLRRARRFNEPTSQFYAAEIALILEFLHDKQGVAYRDLKPENILIDAQGHLKLVDFGFAKRLEKRMTNDATRESTVLTSTQEKHIRYAARLNTLPLKSSETQVHLDKQAALNTAQTDQLPRPRHPSRLVGIRHLNLRIPRRPTSLLGPKPNENLRTVIPSPSTLSTK